MTSQTNVDGASIQSIVTRPILFSGAMVRALLHGRKTQTRRVVTDDHFKKLGLERDGDFVYTTEGPQWNGEFEGNFWCPYGSIGEKLWVRESFTVCADSNIFYRADGKPDPWDGVKWKPSIHMPRKASRITVEITGTRIERVQSISREDAIAEGIFLNANDWWDAGNGLVGQSSPEIAFRELWASINGAESWIANPWVWVVEFRRV
jgi:hypothetical protein